jgi:hypothetical protein
MMLANNALADTRTHRGHEQRGQNHAVEISRAFPFKLCLNVESLIYLSNGPIFSDNLFKNRFDG